MKQTSYSGSNNDSSVESGISKICVSTRSLNKQIKTIKTRKTVWREKKIEKKQYLEENIILENIKDNELELNKEFIMNKFFESTKNKESNKEIEISDQQSLTKPYNSSTKNISSGSEYVPSEESENSNKKIKHVKKHGKNRKKTKCKQNN